MKEIHRDDSHFQKLVLSKINTTLARPIIFLKKNLTNIKNVKRKITIDSTEIRKLIKITDQLYANILEHFFEM